MRRLVKSVLPSALASLLACLGASAQDSGSAPESSTDSLQPKAVRRVALIIGNRDYANGPPVKTADSDAEKVAERLKLVHFEISRTVVNVPSKDVMVNYIKELRDFAGPPSEPAIILFYFAGHGFQNGRWPFLIPTNADPDPQRLYDDSVPLSKAVELLANRRYGVAIFIVDACRTLESPPSNPKPAEGGEPAPSVSHQQASQISFSATDPGSRVAVLALSTEASEPAPNDSFTINGLSAFADALTSSIPSEDSLDAVLEHVQTVVSDNTHEYQYPVIIKGAHLSHFYLKTVLDSSITDQKAWQSAFQTKLTKSVQDFARDYPGSDYLIPAVHWLRCSNGRGPDDRTSVCPP